MIQRKQSIYLALIAVLGLVFLFVNPLLLEVQGADKWTQGETGTVEVSILKIDRILNGESVLFTWNSYLIYSLSVVIFLSLCAIFLFKNRKLQLLLCGFNFLAMAAFGAFVFIYGLEGKSWVSVLESSSWHYMHWLAVLWPLWNFMAMKGILHDEKLIRSMDRIR